MFKRFEGVEQGLLVVPDVVAVPAFPQCKGAEAVVGKFCAGGGDDITNNFSRAQLDAGAVQLPGDDSRGRVFAAILFSILVNCSK